MQTMTLPEALALACADVGITVPNVTRYGVWIACPVLGKSAGNRSGRVLIFEDGRGGVVHNWSNGIQKRFFVGGCGQLSKQDRREQAQRAEERRRHDAELKRIVADVCQRIVETAEPDVHPYLKRKGFPDELGLVHADPRSCFPQNRIGDAMARALPKTSDRYLIVPGRLDGRITTVQFITNEGHKKNLLHGAMSGASHRIATGRDTWVCEGIATAMTVRAAMKALGRSVTILSAFSASNVARVARHVAGAVVAADHDKPVEQFGGLGTGEYWARQSGCRWSMPPTPGDFNDMYQNEGLRAVVLHLKGV